MEHNRKLSEDILTNFQHKELIGIGSNGNRIYKAINSKDKKVSLIY